jgi:3-phenylpropionate/cinnamic acid dioxygenase small subunit
MSEAGAQRPGGAAARSGSDAADWVRDRLEIDDLLTRYATAIDTMDLDLLDEVFTPDADCDYEVVGGFRGDRAAFKAWLGDVLGFFSMHLHYVTNRRIAIGGDEATAVSYLYNPCTLKGGDGTVLTEGGRYHDRLVRTPEGWRIVARREEPLWNTWPPGLRP